MNKREAVERERVRELRYGVYVTEDKPGEKMRTDACLCLRCVRLVTQEDVYTLVDDRSDTARMEELKSAFNCPTAQANYENCVLGGVAAPITRCPLYVFADK